MENILKYILFLTAGQLDSVKYAHKTKVRATTIKGGNFVLYLFMALSAKLWLFTRVNRRMEMIKNHCVRKVSSIDKRIFSSLTFIFVKKSSNL